MLHAIRHAGDVLRLPPFIASTYNRDFALFTRRRWR